MKIISLQNKKNLRQRMNRLHISVNKIVEYGIHLSHQGSLKKGSGAPKIYANNEIDLDVDFIIKTNDSAKQVRQTIYKAIKENLRDNEFLSNKTRVIRVSVSRDGYTYHYDICIKNFDGKAAQLNGNDIKWV